MDAIVVISDLHVGSYVGLSPEWGIKLDNGAPLPPSKFQRYMWDGFKHFWREFVPTVTQGARKVAVVINGDVVDGDHHDAVDLVANIADQENCACEILQPIRKRYEHFVVVRGTEVHGGKSEQSTERIAKSLDAVVDPDTEKHSWWQYWLEADGLVTQFAHHIGTTSSAAYESSAPMRELVAGLVEAAQWGQRLPSVFVRSHRHRFLPISIPSETGRIDLIVTPGWQLRTPHVERIDRMRLPHIGGVVLLCEEGRCTIREKLYQMPKPTVNQL